MLYLSGCSRKVHRSDAEMILLVHNVAAQVTAEYGDTPPGNDEKFFNGILFLPNGVSESFCPYMYRGHTSAVGVHSCYLKEKNENTFLWAWIDCTVSHKEETSIANNWSKWLRIAKKTLIADPVITASFFWSCPVHGLSRCLAGACLWLVDKAILLDMCVLCHRPLHHQFQGTGMTAGGTCCWNTAVTVMSLGTPPPTHTLPHQQLDICWD